MQACTLLNIIPLRAEPSHRSEMVSQVLFGEKMEILEEETDFIKVRMIDTLYEGWIQRTQLHTPVDTPLSDLDYIVGLTDVYLSTAETHVKLYHTTKIPGSELQVDGQVYRISGELRRPSLVDFEVEFDRVIAYYLRSPYLWGGRSVAGIDCSGFSQAVYAHFGIPLLRDAYQQAEGGQTVDFLAEIKAGDLAFFDNEAGRITHVGILLDSENIAHASGEVRIDRMDQQGIFSDQQNRYTHKLRIIKRYF